MIADIFQDSFGHFENFQNIDQNWTLGPLIYYRNTFKNKETMDAIYNKYHLL